MKCMGAMVLRFQMKIHLMPDILFFFNLYVNNYWFYFINIAIDIINYLNFKIFQIYYNVF